MGKTVIITLGVDARALYTAYPPSSTAPTQTQLDPYCHMNDDNDGSIQPPGGTVNDFTSQVYKGNTVRWRINRHDASAGGSYTVKIISIVNNSSPAFFDPSTILGGDGGATTVDGTCLVDSGTDTYTINFRVTKGGEDPGHNEYSFDPKLGGNP